jgi:hypothetical protein
VRTLLARSNHTVTYRTTIDNVKYLFGPAEPVARLKPGDTLDTNTLDCFGNKIKKPGDTLAMAKGVSALLFIVNGSVVSAEDNRRDDCATKVKRWRKKNHCWL